MRLGGFGAIGWTSWLAPDRSDPDGYRCDAQFNPADIIRQKRQRRKDKLEGAPA
jgi:type VI secretion system protein ImpH